MPRETAHTTAMNGWSIVSKIKPGHADKVRAAIAGLGTFDLNSPDFPLRKLGSVHCAKWFVVGDDYFVFISHFDGSGQQYAEDFFEIFNAEGVKTPFMYCEGWTDTTMADREEFYAFFEARNVKSILEFNEFPGVTLPDMRKALATRKGFSDMLDQMQ